MKNLCNKFKALIGLSLLSAGLAACSPTVEGWQVLAAQKFCDLHGGIDHMTTFSVVSATCRDGTLYDMKRGG